MAKVHVQVIGGPIQEKEAGTLQELKDSLGKSDYVATVNGEPADNGYSLRDYDAVSLSKPVKAGGNEYLEVFRGNGLAIRRRLA